MSQVLEDLVDLLTLSYRLMVLSLGEPRVRALFPLVRDGARAPAHCPQRPRLRPCS